METTQFKANVKSAAAYLEQAGINVPHTQLLEAISKAFGERNWSTMRAMLENPPAPTVAPDEEEASEEWDPSQGPMPEALFLKEGANRCPICGCHSIDSDAPEADGPDAWDVTECSGCDSTYNTNYRISGYTVISYGKNAPGDDADVDPEVVESLVDDVRHRSKKHGFSTDTSNVEDAVRSSADLLDLDPSDAEVQAAIDSLLG